ncbi:dCTP deaminase [Vibrio ostreicida]|uniref:dCTP deaminase n=1 Tax=Vibrio ostreicida TaxID=526588 RepID=A0ABT8BTR1_9VIBR|nr:dCTP deaminase [Vibrio ostreicida]MDN3609756.1 dCTP deaminase [Vibrio ostreicida]NPD09414.1 dCTP deaminase [Vibrio ostreicida]
MILTGKEIEKRVNSKEIIVSPFLKENVNPNSYNFRLGRKLKVYRNDLIDPAKENPVDEITLGDDGLVLQPRKLYLAETIETMGSENFVPTYAARSSVARMGMFINLSAPLGDIGFVGKWTIQLFCIHPVKVYYGMNIGQMMFWHTSGEVELYDGKYQSADGPIESRIHIDFHDRLKQRNQMEVPSLVDCVESV